VPLCFNTFDPILYLMSLTPDELKLLDIPSTELKSFFYSYLTKHAYFRTKFIADEYLRKVLGISHMHVRFRTLSHQLTYNLRGFLNQAIDSGKVFKYNSRQYKVVREVKQFSSKTILQDPALILESQERSG
jgi:hypothetical protein